MVKTNEYSFCSLRITNSLFMKLSLIGLLLCLCWGTAATAQQLYYTGIHFGTFSPIGQLKNYHRNDWHLGGELSIPLRFTGNRLWITTEANGNLGKSSDFKLPLETQPGRITLFEPEIYSSNFNFRSQLRYHFSHKQLVSPFVGLGIGYGLLNNSIWVRDPQDSFENCLPLLAEQDFKSRPFFAVVSTGFLINAKDMLQRPQGRKVGSGGVLFSVNYLHGQNITVLPFRNNPVIENPGSKDGIPVIAPFQSPSDPADVHFHRLTTRYQSPLRALEIRLSLLFCPFSSYDD